MQSGSSNGYTKSGETHQQQEKPSSSGTASNVAAEDRPFIGTDRVCRSRRANVDYFSDHEFGARLHADSLYTLDVYRWEDDDIALRTAARQSRLPYNRMTDLEVVLFPEFAKKSASRQLFFYLRNRILSLWHLDPLIELTLEAIMKELPPPYDSDQQMIQDIHAYLNRYGYINYGCFLQISNTKLTAPKRVVVIGAGLAGLAATRKLCSLGFDVTLLEARKRVGGRVMTYRRDELTFQAELGANLIQGIVGNPLVTLIQQINVGVSQVNMDIPILETNGKPIDTKRDQALQKAMKRMIQGAIYLAHEKNINEIDGKKLTLNDAFEVFLDQQELKVFQRRQKYWEKFLELTERQRKTLERIEVTKNAIEKLVADLEAAGVDMEKTTHEMLYSKSFADPKLTDEEFERLLTIRSNRIALYKTMEMHIAADKEYKQREEFLEEFKTMEPSSLYITSHDRRVWNWHIANLEYGLGAPLSSVSLRDWNHTIDHAFSGSYLTVDQGLSSITDRLIEGLPDVKLDAWVEYVKYNDKGVTVIYSSQVANGYGQNGTAAAGTAEKGAQKQQPIRSHHQINADAVICTIPLGILKRMPSPENEPPSQKQQPQNSAAPMLEPILRFDPPLPDWKRQAIASISYGIVNKLVMQFDQPFWPHDMRTFGRLNETPSSASRGEMFLFYAEYPRDVGLMGKSVILKPTLVALFSGEAATIPFRANSDEILINKAMSVLSKMFPNCPRRPVQHTLTLWERDRFARGSYSYMTPNSKLSDIDDLARPLCSQNGLHKVFFAGEHTSLEHQGTMHGAFLSGLREAANVANLLLGPPVKPSKESANRLRLTLDASFREAEEYERREAHKMETSNAHLKNGGGYNSDDDELESASSGGGGP